MASLPRHAIIQDNAIFHVTWQCHNQDWLLEEAWAKQKYYSLLLKYKDKYQISIYSYCLMDNHIHLSGCFEKLEAFSCFFKTVNSCFAKFYNKQMTRRGQVVMDRFKSPQIQNEDHLLNVMTYIDLNPYRANKVKHPKYNKFSSFAYYAYGKNDPLITAAPIYLLMGNTAKQRQLKYRDIVEFIFKQRGRQKQQYSHTCFIGDPYWVMRRHQQLKTKIRRLNKSYRSVTNPLDST